MSALSSSSPVGFACSGSLFNTSEFEIVGDGVPVAGDSFLGEIVVDGYSSAFLQVDNHLDQGLVLWLGKVGAFSSFQVFEARF